MQITMNGSMDFDCKRRDIFVQQAIDGVAVSGNIAVVNRAVIEYEYAVKFLLEWGEILTNLPVSTYR